jgi:FKBP-type peptidyl-prolyl cis-trans isomerase 2
VLQARLGVNHSGGMPNLCYFRRSLRGHDASYGQFPDNRFATRSPGRRHRTDDAGRYARIIWILPEKALIDFNHPLAGQLLIVTLQIVAIENQNEEASIL